MKRLFLPLILGSLLIVVSARAETYRVGSGEKYATFASLPPLQPGDVVAVAPGVHNEFVRWSADGTAEKPITVRGLGANRTSIIDGTGLTVSGEGKVPRALFQIEGDHVVIENLEFRNGRNGHNGAGLRINGATGTTIRDCTITRCEMGIMSNDNDALLIDSCEIMRNGNPTNFAGFAHNLYLEGGKTTIRFCSIHDAITGMNVKSRGHSIELLYNWIADSDEGEISFVDSAKSAAAGSDALLVGNVIVSKADRAGNTGKFIDWGQDMGGARTGTLTLLHNTLIAGDRRIAFLASSAPGARIVATNNIFFGSDTIIGAKRGDVSGSSNWLPQSATVPPTFSRTVRSASPGFRDAVKRDFSLSPTSPCRAAGAGIPGGARPDLGAPFSLKGTD